MRAVGRRVSPRATSAGWGCLHDAVSTPVASPARPRLLPPGVLGSLEADFGLFNAKANGGAVAFFAHVGGFIFGLLVARLFVARAGQAEPEERWPWTT